MPQQQKIHFKRVMLKLSGEALAGKKEYGIDPEIIKHLVLEIKALVDRRVQLGIIIGGGNFFRGGRLKETLFTRIAGDQMGMIATMLNAIALQDIFIQQQIATKILSPLPLSGIIEQYEYRRASEYLASGIVLIFPAGTGNPLVTTDTALCLRGIELKADLLLKATKVDGVYEQDPIKHHQAKFYHKISYQEVLTKGIAIMDATAFTLGKEHQMKLRIFNLHKQGALLRIVQGLQEGTLIE